MFDEMNHDDGGGDGGGGNNHHASCSMGHDLIAQLFPQLISASEDVCPWCMASTAGMTAIKYAVFMSLKKNETELKKSTVDELHEMLDLVIEQGVKQHLQYVQETGEES